jgi:phage terminase large subunit-like protein
MSKSLAHRLVERLGPEGMLKAIPHSQRERLQYEWEFWARPEQLPPDKLPNGKDWLVWLVLAGRGFGKTRLAVEWIRRFAFDHPGSRIAIVGRTASDVRGTMLEGPSGLLTISPPWFMPVHEPSKMKITWPNGSVALTFSAEEPKGLRGPQFNAAWCDELASWPMLGSEEDASKGVPFAWTQLEYGMRLPGEVPPQVVVTTTPRPVRIIRDLLKDTSVATTRGSMFDNAANLAPEYVERMRQKWDGTRLGRQELYAEVLEDIEGALWSHDMIEESRITLDDAVKIEFMRIVVAIDPSGSAKKEADEAGIVVAGVAKCPFCPGALEPHGFVIEDISGRYSPNDMGHKAIEAYYRRGADRLVAEDNFGGQLIDDLIHLIDPSIAYKSVHASRGKIVRAEPIAALYERRRVHHIGMFAKLEDELCTFTPTEPKSPGRLDALVWALTDLMIGAPYMGTTASYDSPVVTHEHGITEGERETQRRVDEICG